jgi:acetylornithine deacetylase
MLDPIAITRELVALETPTGNEGPATSFMAGLLDRMGYRVVRQTVSPGRENLYAYREPPVLVFSTHLDCVPPYLPLKEDAKHLYGRGTCDAKGLAAAMLSAAESLAAQGERRIGLLFVVGEENGSDGAKAAAALEPKGRFLINGEPTENRLSIGQKGSLKMVVEASGRAAHSGYPDLGESAILLLLDALERLRHFPLPSDPLLGTGTLNIGRLEGGVAPNVIAAAARAELLFRTVGPTAELQRALAECAGPGVRVSFPVELPFCKNAAPSPPGWETTVVSYASDLPFHASWGAGYQLGPGSITVAHTADERIEKAALLHGAELYVRLARELLGSA